jgi:hypothetical protein
VTTKRKQRGPAPEVLKIEGDWKDAVAKMLRAPQSKPPPAKKRKK